MLPLPLNRPELRAVEADYLYKIISRGLYGTSMPAWSKEDGGALSDYQIASLASFIQNGDWQQAQDRVVNLGLAPLIPFTAQPDPALIEQAGLLEGGDQLVRGIEIYAVQCVACHGADGLGTALAPACERRPGSGKSVNRNREDYSQWCTGHTDGSLEEHTR